MKKISITICLIIAVSALFAPIASAEDFQWASDYRNITQIYPDTDFQFYLEGTTIDINSSCANRFVIRSNDTNYAAKVASLMMAFQNDGTVKVQYDNDDTGCGTDVAMFKVSPPE